MKHFAFSTGYNARHCPAPIGSPRARLYEFSEVVETMGLRTIEASRLRKKYQIESVFGVKPLKYRLSDFITALKKERGEFVPQVEKNVPIPRVKPVTARESAAREKVALLKEAGDSILAESVDMVFLRRAALAAGFKIVTRRALDAVGEMHRIWRLA